MDPNDERPINRQLTREGSLSNLPETPYEPTQVVPIEVVPREDALDKLVDFNSGGPDHQ